METKERIINILCEQICIEPFEAWEKENDDMMDAFGMDSLDVVEIVVSIEREFGLKLEDSEIDGLKSINDLVNLIEKKRRGR